MVVLAKKSAPGKDLENLVQELNRLASEHFEIGRRLQALAGRLSSGELDYSPATLGEVADRLIARIIDGQGNDGG